MSPELESTLITVGVIAAILMAASALAGAPLFAIPVFFGGAGSAIGALIGELFGQPIVGAVIGVVGFVGCVVWWIHGEVKRDKEAKSRQDNHAKLYGGSFY